MSAITSRDIDYIKFKFCLYKVNEKSGNTFIVKTLKGIESKFTLLGTEWMGLSVRGYIHYGRHPEVIHISTRSQEYLYEDSFANGISCVRYEMY